MPGRGDREAVRHRSLLPRFADAVRGILQTYREEPNLRFHVFAGATSAVAGVAVSLRGWEVAYLTITVALVLLAEMVNTAIERTIDFAAEGQHHPLAGQAKEIAAGAVLVMAVHATLAAGYLFIVERGFAMTVHALITLWLERPWLYLFPLAAGLLGLFGGVSADRSSVD